MNQNQTIRRCSASFAAEQTEIFLGCFRQGEAQNADVYVNAVAVIFSAYPEEVVLAVVHPLTGLPGKSKWLPTVAEVKAACDEQMGPVWRQMQREREKAETWARLAPPQPDDQETRDRAIAKWDAQKAEMAEAALPVVKAKETPDQTLARLRNEPVPQLSAAVLERLGVKQETEETPE